MRRKQQSTPTPAPVNMAHLFAQRTERLRPVYNQAIVVLIWSFRIGAGLLLLGIILAIMQRQPLNDVTEPFDEVLPSVLRGDAAGVVDLAILWLMATPVVVVLVVATGFLRLGERRYAFLSFLVLLILAFSIALAVAR